MAKPLYVIPDKQKSPALANAMAAVRGSMLDAAERAPLPARFDAIPHPDQPAMILTDAVTGRATIVPLFAYGAVRKALGALFAEAV